MRIHLFTTPNQNMDETSKTFDKKVLNEVIYTGVLEPFLLLGSHHNLVLKLETIKENLIDPGLAPLPCQKC
jgi:hypothetical protein